MQAGALLAAGRSQAQVAHQLGVARQNVSRWHARWQAGGLEALRSAGPTGHAPRLSDQQLHRIDHALRQGARAHGFDTDHWTLARVTTVIEQLMGSPTIPATPGSCYASACAGAGNAPPAAPSSVTSGPSPAEWPRTGPRIRRNAPELNPFEPLWSNLKGVELANLAGDTLDDIIAAAERGIHRIRHTHHLPFSFLRHCGLSLW